MTTEKDRLLKLAIDTANEMEIKIIDSNNGKHYIGDEELTKEVIKEMIYGEDMDKNEYVYCTNCKHFELLDNKTPFCININKCNISNPEDSLQYKDRPYYNPNYQLNKKAIYVSGILTHMREVNDMISAMEYGRVNYNHNLYAEIDALKFELNKIRRMNGDLYIGEIEKE